MPRYDDPTDPMGIEGAAFRASMEEEAAKRRLVHDTPKLLAQMVKLAEAQLAEQRITNDLLRKLAGSQVPAGDAPRQ